MSEKNSKNLFLKFLSPNQSTQTNQQENNTKILKHISGGRRVEETYRMLEKAAEQSIDGIAVADMNGNIQFCNQAWAKMHGYHIYELLGKNLSIFHTQEQLKKVVIPFNEQVKKTGAYHGEVGHVRKNGKTFSTWMATTLLKDEKGKPIGFLGIARNITKYKRMQEILAASERRYRSLFENSIEGIGISKGNRVIAANKALLDIFGYETVEEFTKVPLLYHVALESRDKIRERMKMRQKGEYVQPRFEYRVIRKNGEIRDIEASSSDIAIGNEKYTQTTFRDITENKKAEIVLRESEKKYQDLYQYAPDMFLSVEAKTGRIIQCNQTLLEATGYSEAEVIGRHIFDMYHPDCSEELKKIFELFRATGEVRNKELRILRKDRTEIDISLNVSAVCDENDNILYSRSVWRDITESKKTEKKISKINKCFLDFGADPNKNINSLVGLCGEVMEATCAIYSRIDKGMLYSIGQWQVPSDFNPVNKPEGLTCYDVIKKGGDGLFVVRNLDESNYALTDPYVLRYKLKTYIGMPVKFAEEPIGSLCVVYQKDFIPTEEDKRFMQIIASAIAVEEKRRLSKEELQKSEDKYRTLTDNINVGIYRVVGGREGELIEGKFIEANNAIIKMFGYDSREEFFSARLSDLYQDLAIVEKIIRRILKEGSVKNDELLLKRKNGTLFTGSISAVGIRDERGRIQYIDGIIEDITQRKELEADLQNSELQYRTTIDSMADAIHVVDKDLRLVLFNKYFQQWNTELGLETEVIGKTIFEVFPFLSSKIRDEYNKVFQTGEILVTEEHNKIKEKEFITETQKIPIFEGERVVRVATVLRNITDIKMSAEILQGKEHFLSSVFESLQDGISVSDKEMRIIRVNSTMEKWYEHALPLIGKKCYEAYHGRDKLCDVCPTIKTLKTGKPAYEVVPWIGRDGKVKGWFDLYSFPLVDTQTNQITGVIEYVRDITQRKLAEEKSDKLNKRLFKSNRRLEQLVVRDPHTGLYNYRYLQDAIESEFCRAERYAQPFSAIMLDLDYFKSINDAYSHQFGDLVLKQFSRQLKRMVRKCDSVIRFGGEEFVVICPGIDKQTTLILAQRILDRVNLTNFGGEKQSVKLKSSLAVVSYPEDSAAKGMDLIELADRILNRAKEDGGDRVYSSGEINQRKAVLGKAGQKPNVRFLKVKIDRLHKRANQSLIESVFAFARTIKLKDHYTGEHVERTVHYATQIAKELNLAKDDIEHVRRASMLHDLGKIGISENILLKKGRLTKREVKDIKKHPQIGVDILRPIHFLRNIIPLIHYHHERWDGKGYPHGLKNEEIPVGARIVAIADVFQALTSDRPYHKAYPKSKAIEIIKAGSGTQFDPNIVDTFLKILQR